MNDPASILAREKMGWLQVAGVVLCVMLNALDGFDVLSISFASPGIAAQWGIDRAALGVVLSMELIGMALGAISVGTLADMFGRRPLILACLVIMASGMFLASGAGDLTTLSTWRLLTGLGIGGMLASTNAMTAELANDRRRNLCISLMAGGYPVGAALGGTVASLLLVHGTWRAVFLFGAIVSTAMIPLTLLFLPESVFFLARKGGANALAKINRILARMGHAAADALAPAPSQSAFPLTALFAPGMALTTILLTIGYSAHILTFYFILKWVPKIVVDMGFAASTAGGVLVWANIGGALGALFFSLLTQRVDLRILLLCGLVMSAIMVSLFGQVSPDLHQLSMVAGAAGFFTNGSVVCIYTLIARCYPTALRAGGTGFVIGIGRGGAAGAPIVAGLLFTAGFGLPAVAILMAMGSLIAAVAVFSLKNPARV